MVIIVILFFRSLYGSSAAQIYHSRHRCRHHHQRHHRIADGEINFLILAADTHIRSLNSGCKARFRDE